MSRLQERGDGSLGDTFPARMPAVNPASSKQSSSSQTDNAANTGISRQLVSSNAIPSGSDGEITFISGITSSATVAPIAYATWNGDNPATYKSPNITYQMLYGPSRGLAACGT